MEIIPDSKIWLLTGVPLDNSYKDTLTFGTIVQQKNYFLSKNAKFYDKVNYQRVNVNKFKITENPENLYNINYCMFQNTAFGDKMFYAFVLEVNYINATTTEIVYEIDIIQSWLFQYEFKQSFVEREHVNDDTIGLNTLPENLELGGYITTDEVSYRANDFVVVLMATEDIPVGTMNPPAIVGGFPVPCYWKVFGILTDITMAMVKGTLDEFALAGKVDAVVSLFVMPYSMGSVGSGIDVNVFTGAVRTPTITPKNNKLLTYPYISMAMTALGQGCELRYELFDDPAQPQFKTRGGFGANMQVACVPLNYEGQNESLQNTLSIKDFPILGWVSNYFQNWLAQNKASIAVSTISSAVNMVGGGVAMALSGGVAGGGQVLGGITSIAQTMASIYQHSIIPDKMNGTANAGDILAISGLSGFYSYCRSIRPEYAQKIDDFFTMFGYKVNALKVPNLTGRTSFNYVKTIDAVVTGDCPANATSKMRQLLDRGLTFWHGDWVGDYSRDNSIVT